jgi:hypothetical protein
MDKKIREFFQYLSFAKFVVTLVFFGVLNFTLLQWTLTDHIEDKNIHVSEMQDRILDRVEEQGFPFTEEKEKELIDLRNDVNELLWVWTKANEQGRLQSPEEKKELIQETIKEYLKANGYNGSIED